MDGLREPHWVPGTEPGSVAWEATHLLRSRSTVRETCLHYFVSFSSIFKVSTQSEKKNNSPKHSFQQNEVSLANAQQETGVKLVFVDAEAVPKGRCTRRFFFPLKEEKCFNPFIGDRETYREGNWDRVLLNTGAFATPIWSINTDSYYHREPVATRIVFTQSEPNPKYQSDSHRCLFMVGHAKATTTNGFSLRQMLVLKGRHRVH